MLPVQYHLPFYLQYLAQWPEYFLFAEAPGGACQGYSALRLAYAAPALAKLTRAARSHGQGGGQGRELARPRDGRHGAALHAPGGCGAAFSLVRHAGGARVPPARAGAEADGHPGGDHHQAARARSLCALQQCMSLAEAACVYATRPRWLLLRRHDGYFVDLFVRKSNSVAIGMYEKARGASKKSVFGCAGSRARLRSSGILYTGRSSATTPARRTRTVRARRGCR